VIEARHLAAHTNGNRAGAVTLLVGITTDGPAASGDAAREGRHDPVAAGETDDSGRRTAAWTWGL